MIYFTGYINKNGIFQNVKYIPLDDGTIECINLITFEKSIQYESDLCERPTEEEEY